MRTGLYIPQAEIIKKELLGSVTTDAWLVLDYIRRWSKYDNTKKVQRFGRDYLWIKYTQACRELPIIFPGKPTRRTQLNKMVYLIASLRKAGLIDTFRQGSRCYVYMTDIARSLYAPSHTAHSAIMVQRDYSVTNSRDGHDMQAHEGQPAIYNKKEQYKENKELYCTQNTHTNEQLECVKRAIEVIFPKRIWSNEELRLLKGQMIIPQWEILLIHRFYQMPKPAVLDGVPDTMRREHEFHLLRRRQTRWRSQRRSEFETSRPQGY